MKMENTDESIFYPLEVGNEISFMLYNYENIDEVIDKRKQEIIDRMNGSSSAWLKSKNIASNTLEDIVIRLQNDKKLKRLKKWKKFLEGFIKGLKEYDKPIYYNFINMKYFKKCKKQEIMNKLKLNNEEYDAIKINLKWVIYCYAINEKLYKEIKDSF